MKNERIARLDRLYDKCLEMAISRKGHNDPMFWHFANKAGRILKLKMNLI